MANRTAKILDCETCSGTGEVIADWEKYLEQHEDALAECDDCDGKGTRSADPEHAHIREAS
ncbi:hypothetical protein [Roseibium sp. Sym1]|uniref:hypothetical protein n=1 Tax=Roseibium sp. Sym1 TaxID=3016006 RepID=UPI0022B4FCD4|nr:hypothetical protein [Roseibium sp. Sym1]